MKNAPSLYGFTACKPSDPPTGGRAGSFGAAVRSGRWPDLLRSRVSLHRLRVAHSAMEN